MTYHRVEEPTEVVVIFKTHLRRGADVKEYKRTSRRTHEIVEAMPGFISIKGYPCEDGEEIEIVRFQDETAIDAWRTQPEHRTTQDRGRREFYDRYSVRRDRLFASTSGHSTDLVGPKGLSSGSSIPWIREVECTRHDAPEALPGPA
jgi:heme-degrading monooxygenase HmoA